MGEQLIDTMPNLSGVPGIQTHIVALPSMCPVSGNPRPGSYVAIRYTDAGRFLEVYELERYIQRFVGGWLSRGIRDMEQTVDTIAKDCAQALGVPVRVRARLILDAGRMHRTAEAQPCI